MKPSKLSTRWARWRKAVTSASDSLRATRRRDIDTYIGGDTSAQSRTVPGGTVRAFRQAVRAAASRAPLTGAWATGQLPGVDRGGEHGRGASSADRTT